MTRSLTEASVRVLSLSLETGLSPEITGKKEVQVRDIMEALIALRAEDLGLGAAWQTAHHLAQQHEGVAAYDRLHALLHRIEGDEANAAYWYRRAGETVFAGSLAEEVQLLIGRSQS